MSINSKIEWTEATWNPVTGCDRISRGCDNCYALTLASRLKSMGAQKYQSDGNPSTSGPGFGVALHPQALDQPKRWRSPRVVFVNSMSDLFHAKVPLGFIRDVFQVMEDTPRHTYQVLTKRPRRALRLAGKLDWPRNLWVGCSVEDMSVVHRAKDLSQLPAAVKFLSCEPLLGPLPNLDLAAIDWIIVGGESGVGCRPMRPHWVVEIRDGCQSAGVPFFFKQWGGRTAKSGGRLLEGRTWDEMPPRVVVNETGSTSRQERCSFSAGSAS
ncbi:phage Gp37/Gp68 family protein [Actinopolymorpha sp. B9G3]|uniref:DUF5131 family protein n=1 Tax=Actinopolymorpha sp. B9G3 TaxID=3158970 RepID=UPI0032D8FF9F